MSKIADDLKQRLRAVCETGCDPDLPFEAADRIEQLEAEVERLKTTPAYKREDLHCVVSDLCEQVQEAEAERDYAISKHLTCDKMVMSCFDTIAELRNKLAAEIANCDELKAAAQAFADWYDERSGDNECRPLENLRAAIAKGEKHA